MPVVPEPEPEPGFFAAHAPGEQVHAGSFGGHAQPVPYQVHALSALHAAVSV